MGTKVLFVKRMNDNFSSLSAPRIVEERKRLNLSQVEVGRVCGVSREMWGKYERGIASMGAEVLAQFVTVGADVNYILTGERSGSVFSTEEKMLVEGFRRSPKSLREAAIRVLFGGGDEKQPKIKQSIGGKNTGVVATGNVTIKNPG